MLVVESDANFLSLVTIWTSSDVQDFVRQFSQSEGLAFDVEYIENSPTSRVGDRLEVSRFRILIPTAELLISELHRLY